MKCFEDGKGNGEGVVPCTLYPGNVTEDNTQNPCQSKQITP